MENIRLISVNKNARVYACKNNRTARNFARIFGGTVSHFANGIVKVVLSLVIIALLGSCSPKGYCPTYSNVPGKPKKEEPQFTNAEKTGFVLFGVFVIWASNLQNND